MSDGREVTDQELLADLVSHPGWQALEREIEARHEKARDLLVSGVMRGDLADQREIDKLRGRIQAGEELLRVPQRAAERIKEKVTAGG